MTFASLVTNVGSRKLTPINKIIPGRESEQSLNNAGGVSFIIDGWSKLDRFLVIGSENSTYYASESKIVKQGTENIKQLIIQDGVRVVNRCVEISQSGRARNNDYALLVMAMAITHGNLEVKHLTAEKLPLVARTASHLMHFTNFANSMRGWGAILKFAVANFYESKTADQIAYQAIKYQSRDGWSQRDVLRLSHPKAGDDVKKNSTFKWIVKGVQGLEKEDVTPDIIQAFESAKTASEGSLVKLIIDHRLSHEMIPNEMKGSPAVWEALYQHMGTTALIRNLNKLTSLNLLNKGSYMVNRVAERLNDVEILRKDRIHPLQVLIAQRQYSKGHGDKGNLVWNPSSDILEALENSFYHSFQAVEPTGKNIMLALDVSASMNSLVQNGATQLTCREAATVMSMVTARNEPNSMIFGFDHKFRSLGITSTDSLAQACVKTYSRNFGHTNCSLPMQFAQKQGWALDGFVILTDNEVSSGQGHPTQSLTQYRKVMKKPNAKLISVGMAVNDFSIADPKDKGQLDLVGFDSAAPQLISSFMNDLI